nr:effector-associated domain EAD1-containing protein [Flavobacterium sp. CSZ]
MIKIAGKICSKSPKNLNKLKVLDANWQKIWLEAILTGNEIETGLKEPDKEISKLFDSLILGANISEELIDKISQSEHGNILFYPNRSEIWKKFSDNAKNNFLTKTSAALLNQLSLNSNTLIPDDIFIIDHISQKGVWDFLFFNRNNIKSVIPIFDKFNLQDSNLKDYLSNYTGHINAVEATQLGKLIAVKRFSNSAYIINSKASKRNNWKFALAECHYLLDFITKAALVISGTISSVNIPTDEWWQSTEELIVELYPNGTALTTIWKKAGGKESDLLTKSTANEIWSDALYKVRRNQLKKITMNKLLKEIEKQYGDSKKFKIIYGLRKNYIKT